MPEYRVYLQCEEEILVEADDEEAAMDKAWDERGLMNSRSSWQITDVEPV